MPNKHELLSSALIAGAIAVIAAGWPGFFAILDKLTGTGAVLVTLVVCAGMLSLVVSIVFGGQGLAYTAGTGPGNKFDRQAKAALLGLFLLLLVAPFLVLLSLKTETAATTAPAAETLLLPQQVTDLTSQIHSL